MRRIKFHQQGVTLSELLVVVAIIGILSVISLPNIFAIIQMNKFRSSANDLLLKVRFVRDLALKSHRELQLSFDTTAESLMIRRPAYTEYNLLKDIASAVASGKTLDNQYILYEETPGTICWSAWNEFLVPGTKCAYWIGGSKETNAVDTMVVSTTSNCGQDASHPLTINASGTFSDTCTVTLTNIRLDNRKLTLTVYRGGQISLR